MLQIQKSKSFIVFQKIAMTTQIKYLINKISFIFKQINFNIKCTYYIIYFFLISDEQHIQQINYFLKAMYINRKIFKKRKYSETTQNQQENCFTPYKVHYGSLNFYGISKTINDSNKLLFEKQRDFSFKKLENQIETNYQTEIQEASFKIFNFDLLTLSNSIQQIQNQGIQRPKFNWQDKFIEKNNAACFQEYDVSSTPSLDLRKEEKQIFE